MGYFIICRPEPPYFSELLFTVCGGNDKIEAKRLWNKSSGIRIIQSGEGSLWKRRYEK
jgi:hypothetical protein